MARHDIPAEERMVRAALLDMTGIEDGTEVLDVEDCADVKSWNDKGFSVFTVLKTTYLRPVYEGQDEDGSEEI